jgi:glucose-6-phosphate isomerase
MVLSQEFGTMTDVAKHFVAVSTNIEKSNQVWNKSRQCFPMWDWVGGRFFFSGSD